MGASGPSPAKRAWTSTMAGTLFCFIMVICPSAMPKFCRFREREREKRGT